MIHGTGEQCFVLLPNYYQQVQGGQLQAPKNSSCQDESLCPAKRCPAPPPTCAEEAGPSSCSATSSPALRTCEADQSDREWTAECSGRLTAAACRCHIFKSKVNHIVAMVKMLQCKNIETGTESSPRPGATSLRRVLAVALFFSLNTSVRITTILWVPL